MSDLLQKLKESFPIEQIPPHGRVICIPSRLFKDQWRQDLEAQGLRLMLAGHGGQSCFLVKLKEEKQPESSHSDDKEKLVKEPEKKPETEPEKQPRDRRADRHLTPHWTSEERLKLKTLHDSHVPTIEIADRLKKSVFSVAGEIAHLQPRKPWSMDDRKALQQFWVDGVRVSEIAEKLGRSYGSISEQVKHLPKAVYEVGAKLHHPLSKAEAKPAEKPETDRAEDPVREILEGCKMLLDSDKKAACKILLTESIRMLENRRHGE